MNCQTALSSCSCPTLSGSDVNVHTRCLDLSCDAGKQGFCVATTTNCGQTGNVLASPCCGDRGQTCCREGPSCTNTNVNICQSGTCVECGATNMPCCQPGNACRAGFICDGAANRCTACGQPGLPCCVGNGCNGVCQNGQCKTPPPLPAQWTVDVAAYCGGNLVVRNSGGTTGFVSITFSGQDCIGIIYQNQLIGSCASVPPGSSCTVATIGGLLASQQYFLNGTAIAGSRGQCSFGCNFNVPGFFPL